MDLQGELNRLAQIPPSERMRGAAYCANLWAGTTDYELVGALNAKLGRPVNGTCLELNGVLKALGFDLDSNGALVGGVDGTTNVSNVLRLPGLSGNYMSTPDTAAVSITGDIDIRVKVALDSWTPSIAPVFVAKWVNGGQRSWQLVLLPSGNLQLFVSTTGSDSTGAGSMSVAIGNGLTQWIRCTRRVSDGRVQYFTSPDGVVWTQAGTDTSVLSGQALLDTTSAIEVGSTNSGTTNLLSGAIYYAEVRSGIGGPVVAKFDSTTVAVRGDRLPTTHTQPSTAEAVRLPGVAGNYISQPDSVANSVTGDIDLRVKVSADDWTPTTTPVFISKVNTNQRAYQMYLDTTGKLALNISGNGTSMNLVNVLSTSALGFTDGSTNWVRGTFVAATGAYTLQTSTDGVTWAVITSGTGTAGAIWDSTAAVEIGSNFAGGSNAWSGQIYYAEVRNGINGTVVASFDASRTQPTAQQLPTTQDLWTINGTAWSWDTAITEPSSGALRLPGVNLSYVSTPDAADISIVGDIDLRAKVALDDWTPAGQQRVLAKWTGAQRSYLFYVDVGGALKFGWSTTGADQLFASSTVANAIPDGTVKWIRGTYAVATGQAMFYTSDDGVAWTQLGGVPAATGVTSIFDSTAVLEVGSSDAGAAGPVAGYIYRAEVYSGIAGTLVAYFDAQNAPTDTNRTPTTVVQSGRTWTLNGALWEWVNVPAPTPWTVNGSAWYWGTYSGTTRFLNALQLDPQYVVFDGTAGNYASTPDSAALSITGDIDLRAKIAPDTWSPALAQAIVAKYNTGTNQRSYMLRLEAGGSLGLFTSADGVVPLSRSTGALGFTDGTTKWVRVTLDVDNGSSGNTATFYSSNDGVTWTQIGSPSTFAGITAIFDSTALATVGARDGPQDGFAGKVYYAEIRNGIGGSIVGDFVPREPQTSAIRTPNTISMTFPASGTWTMNGSNWSYGVYPMLTLTTPDSAALSITGDIDLRAKITNQDWLHALDDSVGVIDKWSSTAGYRMMLQRDGKIRLDWVSTGPTTHFGPGSSAPAIANGATKWIRATLVVATGTIAYYTSDDGITWTSAGGSVAGATNIVDGTETLALGSRDKYAGHFAGLIHYAEVRNGIAGTVVGVFDPQKIRFTGSDTTPTTVPSATGETYTISGSGWHWVQI